MSGHIIVFGDDALALRIIEVLTDAQINVVRLRSPSGLAEAGLATAQAVVCASAEDALNLEVALLARQANPRTRVVARLANPVLRQAMSDGNGAGAVLDIADLAAPSVVEALLGRTAHLIPVGAEEFVVSAGTADRNATVADLYGDLAPVAVVLGPNSPAPGETIACPGPDLPLHHGDRTTVIGRPTDLTARGLPVPSPAETTTRRRSPVVRFFDSVRAFHDDLNPMFYRALAVAATLLIGSTIILRFAYRQPVLGWVDALSFATETLTTVGYGFFDFNDQLTWLRIWGVVMMLSGVATNAILVAFIADVLLSRRLSQATNVERVRHLRNHFVIVGIGSFGVRVAGMLRAAGHEVVAVERDENSRYLSAAAELGVPVILGDATQRATLSEAGAEHARAVAVLTESDMVNIETGIVLHEMRLQQGPSAGPVVLRIYDLTLGRAVGHRFGFEHVRSTVDLSTPWFIGASIGLEVLGTFSVGGASFMVGGVRVRSGSELDGIRICELSTQARVIAVDRDGGPTETTPGPDTRLTAGDLAYLVGPYNELLDTLRRGERRGVRPGTAGPER